MRDVQVSATVTNVGNRAGADVAQLYLGDPAAAGEPPRQLVGFQRVNLAPGKSTRVQFTITPRDTWWWDDERERLDPEHRAATRYTWATPRPWRTCRCVTRSTSTARREPGRSSINAPRRIHPGQTKTVKVRLTKGGNETLRAVQIALQLPQGWTAQPIGQTSFGRLASGQAAVVKFRVTPPSWATSTNSVVHATADLGPDAQREAGATVTVG